MAKVSTIKLTYGDIEIETSELEWIDEDSFEVTDINTGERYQFDGVDRQEIIAAHIKSERELCSPGESWDFEVEEIVSH